MHAILSASLLTTLLVLVHAAADPLYAYPGAELRAEGYSFQFYVSLVRNIYGVHLCTGALISKNQILTASSCLENYPDLSNIRVVIGASRSQIPPRQFEVESRYTYQDWCTNSISCISDKFTNDISILTLNTRDTGVEPVAVDYNFEFDDGIVVRLVGWGPTKFKVNPNVARSGLVRILSKQSCEERVKKLVPNCFSDVIVPDKVSCAVANPVILGSKGDFGGPVLWGNQRKGRGIVGILIQRCPKYHESDFNPEQVNLILHLAPFRDFIETTLE